jgi:hypothetical protein
MWQNQPQHGSAVLCEATQLCLRVWCQNTAHIMQVTSHWSAVGVEGADVAEGEVGVVVGGTVGVECHVVCTLSLWWLQRQPPQHPVSQPHTHICLRSVL